MKPSGHKPYWLRVSDVQGSYTIPYIQSHRDLSFRVDFKALPQGASRATIVISCDGEDVRRGVVTVSSPHVLFSCLAPGEYTVSVTVVDCAGETQQHFGYSRIGIGTVVAALGDSLTEGYHGHGFWRQILDLCADDFPASAVSVDGRNFPQFSPTTHIHRPSVNCFQSWMTRLNNLLSEAWKVPVFVANEGWGGYTSADYLTMMEQNCDGWCDRVRQLSPAVWLIHLGVNDERHGVSGGEFETNLRGIVKLLLGEFGAAPENIYLARPSYDYFPGAAAVLRTYIAQIEAVVESLGVQAGPDFFATFSQDRETWYGDDPVHPGPEGMDLMADLWAERLSSHVSASPDSVPHETRQSAAQRERTTAVDCLILPAPSHPQPPQEDMS